MLNVSLMPELPEVETIVRQLSKKIIGKVVKTVNILDSKVVDSKINGMVPFKINKVYRRAKSIVMELDNGNNLLTHLRMTGHFHYNHFGKFEVARFNFSDNSFLTHNSIRKFGGIKLLLSSKELEREFSKLGVEPLSKEFTLEHFNSVLLKRVKSNIKTVLLDQSQIAGIGNIYAQEVLYFAGIDPKKKVFDVSGSQVKKLHSEIIRVLDLAVKNKGSTVDNYTNIDGAGSYQGHLVVYNKFQCPKGHKIQKINIGGRGTSYCSTCQR
jgi:formamidopyrimidine-DNA glycosylase